MSRCWIDDATEPKACNSKMQMCQAAHITKVTKGVGGQPNKLLTTEQKDNHNSILINTSAMKNWVDSLREYLGGIKNTKMTWIRRGAKIDDEQDDNLASKDRAEGFVGLPHIRAAALAVSDDAKAAPLSPLSELVLTAFSMCTGFQGWPSESRAGLIRWEVKDNASTDSSGVCEGEKDQKSCEAQSEVVQTSVLMDKEHQFLLPKPGAGGKIGCNVFPHICALDVNGKCGFFLTIPMQADVQEIVSRVINRVQIMVQKLEECGLVAHDTPLGETLDMVWELAHS